jgi:predicted O-linked N-acetylglucosamine transferase (SPINDLY family)
MASVEAQYNMGVALQTQGKLDESMSLFQKAVDIAPNSIATLNNMASALKEQGRLDEAIQYYRRALAINPSSSEIYSNLLLTMIYAASVSPEDLAATAAAFGRDLADPLLRRRPFANDRNPDRKLRVGYVSPDLYGHAVSYFLEPLVKAHDRANFELFAYSNSHLEDNVTARLKQSFDHWRDIRTLNDDETADLIEADKIDILVDAAGHTAGNRLLVFARKPAPVQVSWIGYPASTGMRAIDYRITDIHAEPPGMTENLNTEKLWRLPRFFCCYGAHENSPAVIDHPPFEDNGCITFGCFNNFSRVTDPVLAAWARIMEKAPDSRLLLEIRGIESPQFRAGVQERLQRAGISLSRVILEQRKRSNQFVLYNKIDIALDPFPCVGGTTSMDTLWMGVPLVTLAGRHFLSRIGMTALTNAGLPELIASDADQYIEIASALAQDKERLRALRHGLRDKVARSPLMDQAGFARDMETAYREMWRRWCAETPS